MTTQMHTEQMHMDESPGRHCLNADGCVQRQALCGIASVGHAAPPAMARLDTGECAPPGDPGRVLVYTVHSGLVALCAGLADGRRQIAALGAPGDTLCACSGLGHRCWLQALAPSVLCIVDIAADELALQQRERELVHALLRVSHERLQAALEQTVLLGRLDGAERTSAFLSDLTRRLGTLDRGEWHVPLPMSRQDIADYLGLKPETVSRLLGRLRREGLVRFPSRHEFVVPDLQALEARSPLARSPLARAQAGACPAHASSTGAPANGTAARAAPATPPLRPG